MPYFTKPDIIDAAFLLGLIKQPIESLLRKSISQHNRSSDSTSRLTIKITDQCNCYCAYCPGNASKDDKANYDLSVDLLLKAVATFISTQVEVGVKTINISFYGGEPLLRYDDIVIIINYILNNELIKSGRITCFFSINTNGLLLDEDRIDYLLSNNVRIFISLDGYASIHNCQRISRHVSDTHTKVLRVIKQLSKQSIITIRTVISPTTDFDRLDIYFEELYRTVEPYKFRLIAQLIDFSRTNQSYYKKYISSYDKLISNYESYCSSWRVDALNGPTYTILQAATILSNLKRVIRSVYLSITNHMEPHMSRLCSYPVRQFILSNDNILYCCEKTERKFGFGSGYGRICKLRIDRLIHEWNYFYENRCEQCEWNMMCDVCYSIIFNNSKIIKTICSHRRKLYKIEWLNIKQILKIRQI